MANEFEQFGGRAVAAPETPEPVEGKDPFSQFGGTSVSPEATPVQNDFNQFGGNPVPSTPEVPEDYKKVRETIDRPFLKSPIIGTEVTSNDEINAIAKQHGVDPTQLQQVAGYYGARREGPENIGEEALSSLARGPLMGIPQFASKKAEDDPKFRAAIDDVRELANSKRSMVQAGAEMLLPGGAIATGAKGIAKKVAASGATGLTYGVTGSNEGQEVKSGLIGLGLGTTLGAGAAAIEARLAAKYKPNQTELAMHDNQSKSGQFNIEKGTTEIADATKDSEKILEDIGFKGKEQVSQPEMEKIAQEQLGKEQYEKIMDPSTDEGQIYRKTISPEGQVTDRQIQEKMVNDIVEKRINDFAEDLTGKAHKDPEEAMRAIEEFSKTQGSEATVNKYKDFVRLQQAEKYIENRGLKAMDDPGFYSKAANFISDSQYVLRHIDDKYGTSLQKAHADLNGAYNRSTFPLAEFRGKYDQIFQDAQKLGTDDAVSSTDRIYKALDSGDTAGLTKPELETAGKFKQYFDNVLEFANKSVAEKDPRIAPMSIPKRENYVPHMPLQTPDMVRSVEKRVEQATQDLGKSLDQLDAKELKQAVSSNQDVKDIYDTVRWLNNSDVRDGRDLVNRMNQFLYTRNGHIALETAARAAEERKGGIPEFLLEKNLYKLARRYTDNTIRHLYLRNSVDQLAYEAKKLHKIDADTDAKYVENLIRDIMGVRKGTAAEAGLRTRVELSRKLDKLIDQYGKDSVQGGVLTAAKAIPDMLYAASRQIYPNLLGYFNIRAAAQNLTQPLTKTLPELGTAYGSYVMPRALMYTAANMKKLAQKSEKLGFKPIEHTRAGELAIMDGIRKSSMYQIPARALEGMGKASMILFSKSEEFNRALTTGVADMMAHDLANGSKMAEKSVANFPSYLRTFIANNQQNQELVSQAIGKYLNDSTQFNYNRISMSEFGRTMGPFFSTFSKWPTVTAGDMIYNIRDKGLVRGAIRNSEKYILPFVALQAMDYAMGERLSSKEGLSDRQKKVVGAGGISQSAPIGTVSGFLTGQIFTPPAVDALYKGIIEPVMSGKVTDIEPRDIPEKALEVAGKTGASLAQSFLPGAGLIRFITDDLVTYATGERPEGTNFVERSIEGARRVVK